MQADRFDLTKGKILDKLLLIALPVMGSSLMQMMYNLANMFWLGHLDSDAVAASGSVGMYIWLSMAFMMLGRMGAEIGVSQNLGRGDRVRAQEFSQSALMLSCVLGIGYASVMIAFNGPLIGFFNIQETNIVRDAQDYLVFVSLGIPFTFMTATITGTFNASGNSRRPFILNFIGLGINMALDPLFIHVWDMRVIGAATATVIAQGIVFVLMFVNIKAARSRAFETFRFFYRPTAAVLRQIFKWGTPVALESLLFTFLTMLISRLVASWGGGAIAVQRIGAQIESLSWLLAGGYSTALVAFIGQNYGARMWERIRQCLRISILSMSLWGLIVTAVLYFGGAALYSVFVPNEPEIIAMGGHYLKILALCQLMACIEGVMVGMFRGLGRTIPSSIVSIGCNSARVVLAYVLSQTSLGLDGVWIAVSAGAAMRGVCLAVWYAVRSPLKRAQRLDARKDEGEFAPAPMLDA